MRGATPTRKDPACAETSKVTLARPVELTFEGGTLCLRELARAAETPDEARWDDRLELYRAPACAYASIVRWLRSRELDFVDQARSYQELAPSSSGRPTPFPYQSEALAAWQRHQGRGVVVLPTGSGKTMVACMAIDWRPRTTLVVVPTLDLLHQWFDLLASSFALGIGIVGGGYYELADLTVTTYDSAYLYMDRFGARFGLVVFDECHHLPSPSYALAARACLAPFRLGLTATPERLDGGDGLYAELIGPIVYRKDIDELRGSYLASYETRHIEVDLSEAERSEYQEARATYIAFLRKQGIRMASPSGWSDFVTRSARSAEGRLAFAAYRRQRQLALAAEGKLGVLERLLLAHRRDRCLVFTEDNATVYTIAQRFLVPAITHQTKVKERSAILRDFNSGALGVVVTSKVLNEGVNVPEANVAIVLSGSGSVREHVQRLGRILRKRDGKRAVLYEIVASGTSEESLSERRRDHRAYR
jgi:superfamily II DNA or RNA helicase